MTVEFLTLEERARYRRQRRWLLGLILLIGLCAVIQSLPL